MRSSLLVYSLLLCCAAACNSGTSPPVLVSITLADGRACSDAAVLAVSIDRQSDTPARFLCDNMLSPNQILVGSLPLYDAVTVRGLSTDGAELYRGSFIAANALTGPDPSATVTLYPYVAR